MSDPIQAAINPLERSGGEWSYKMEHIPHPAHVLVTVNGIGSNDTVAAYYLDILIFMDQIVGAGRPFIPIIFDMRDIKIGHVTLPAIWKSPGQVPRRVKQIIIVYHANPESIVDNFVRTLSALFRGMSVTSSLEEAHTRLITIL